MDPATPVWQRLVVDERSRRVLRESVVSKSHLTSTRYTEFDRPIRTVAPDVN